VNDVQVYMSTHQLAQRYGVARETIWRWVRRGTLPRPVLGGPGSQARWSKEEIEARDAKLRRA